MAETIKAEYNYEPLEPSYCPEVRAMKLRNRFLKPDGSYPDEERFLEKVVEGRLIRLPVKVMSRNPLRIYRWKFWRRRTLVKLIQGHLLVPFLKKNFSLKVVFLIRHPCAVIESLTRQDWWNSDLGEFLDGRNEELWQDYPELRKFVEDGLKKLDDQLNPTKNIDRLEKIKRTALRWSIENYFVLSVADSLDIIKVKYEKFYRETVDEIARIASNMEIPDWSIPPGYKEQSQVSGSDSPLKASQTSPIVHWKQQLTEEEKLAVKEIVNLFEIECYDVFIE